MRKTGRFVALVSLLMLFASLGAVPAGADHKLKFGEAKVFAEGLNNPRGIMVAHDGRIYVAEAGSGGDECRSEEHEGEIHTVCFGDTGSVARVRKGKVDRIAFYPSFAEEDGSFAVGAHDVVEEDEDTMWVSVGDGVREFFGTPNSSNALYKLRRHGKHRFVADIHSFEEANDPDGNGADSNPYGIAGLTEDDVLMADAGGNSLLHITQSGKVRSVAVLPGGETEAPEFMGMPPGTMIPYEPVPTAVVIEDGAYYVGELTGFPFPKGEAKVYRVTRKGKVSVYREGFTNIIDIGFGPDGALYVLEFVSEGLLSVQQGGDPTGALIRVDSKGRKKVIMSEGLIFPGGFAFGKDAIYVTNNSVSAGGGQVLKIPFDD